MKKTYTCPQTKTERATLYPSILNSITGGASDLNENARMPHRMPAY
jgi:hypothetical protein